MKKKKKMSKKKKRIIIISLVIVFIIALIVLGTIKRINDTPNSLEDINDIREMIEYLECKYISHGDSDEDGYIWDIHLEFKYSPYEGNQSKKDFYDLAIRTIANYLGYSDFRLIDESRDLIIKVNCESGTIYEVFINDLEESEYFNKLMSEVNLEQNSNLKEIDVTVNQELSVLKNNNWNLRNISFGNKTSTFQGYDIYFENGYRVKETNHTLFNIVFTTKYTNPVINDIKAGDSLETVKQKLGDDYEEDGSLVEYMTKDMYICFTETEISIYPRITYDYTSFEELVKKYNDEKDFVNFMLELTDIWPDYATYDYDSGYSDIWYPLKGIRITNSSDNMDGIQVYQEYSGDLKNNREDLYQVYYKTNQSLILEYEKQRNVDKFAGFMPDDNQSQVIKELYDMDDQNGKRNVSFISFDDNVPDSELSKDIVASSSYWYDDYNYIYSIYGKGIYVYNVKDLTTKTIVEGNNEYYNVTNFDFNTKILTYDNKNIKIEI